MWSGFVGRTLLKDVVWLCWKDITDRCGLVVLEGHSCRMWSGCVDSGVTVLEVWRPFRGPCCNNNNVHLSCAHQRPERSYDTY